MIALQDLVAAARARWKEELALLLLVVGLVGVWTFFSPRIYVARATLLFDAQANGPTESVGSPRAPIDLDQLLYTQADIVTSDAVIQQVIASEQLGGSAAQLGVKTSSGGARQAELLRAVRTALQVQVNRSSNVLVINFRSTDPALAARVANGVVEAYLDTQLRLRVDPAKGYSRWYEQRTLEARAELERAQRALAEFQRVNGFTDAGPMAAETNRLSELSAQLAQAEANAADVRSRAGADAASSVDVQSTQVIQQLRGSIAVQAKRLAELSANYGPRHPRILAAQSEMQSLQSRLADETRQAQASLSVSRNAADRRQAELARLVEVQRQKMISMAGARNEMQVLQRDVESARAAYDQITQQLNSMQLQAQIPSTNVRQLDVASPPLEPASPKPALRLLLASILGGMLAAAYVLGLEWWRPRVRTAVGVQAATGSSLVHHIDFDGSAASAILRKAA